MAQWGSARYDALGSTRQTYRAVCRLLRELWQMPPLTTDSMLTVIQQIVQVLEQWAPPDLAESWDNTGLLLGDRRTEISRIMTCLTLTPDVATEAIQRRAGLVVSHHPILFKPVQRITSDTPEGNMLLELIGAGVAVYSPHTAFDSAEQGINQSLAERLGLRQVAPLRVLSSSPETPPRGSGRFGELPESASMEEFLHRIHSALKVTRLEFTGDRKLPVSRVAVACGSAAEFLRDARQRDCQLLVTGEARFHAFLEARTTGIGLVAIGHYASERPAVDDLAAHLHRAFPDVEVWASQLERDPVQWSLSE